MKLSHTDQNDSTRVVYLTACSVPDGDDYFPTGPGTWWTYRWLREWQNALFEDRCHCLGEIGGAVCFSSAALTVDVSEEQQREYWTEMLEGERRGDDAVGYAHALGQLAKSLWEKDSDRARALWEELVSLHEQTGDEWGLFMARRTLTGLDREEEPSPEEWLRRAQKELALTRKLGHRRHEAIALSNLACTYSETTDYEAAMGHYEEAAAVYLQLGDVNHSAMARAWAELMRQKQHPSDPRKLPVYGLGDRTPHFERGRPGFNRHEGFQHRLLRIQ